MAAKAKKKKTVAKKTTAAVLKNTKTAANAASSFTPNFAAFSKSFPQFQPFKMETNMFKGNKQFEQLTQGGAAMSQDTVDALTKSSMIFAKGMEDIIKTCMDICTEAGEKSQSVAKTAMSCKTLNEFTDFQTKLAQSSYDDFLTNATKISEKTVKLCTEAMAPINDQMGKSMKRASTSMAA